MYSPEDEQLEPEDDGLEDDFPLRKGCILRFQPLIFTGVPFVIYAQLVTKTISQTKSSPLNNGGWKPTSLLGMPIFRGYVLSHTIHVWCIYQHSRWKSTKCR